MNIISLLNIPDPKFFHKYFYRNHDHTNLKLASTSTHIYHLLKKSDLTHVYKILESCHIKTTEQLHKLKYSDLIKIGIHNIQDRIKIYEIINFLKKDFVNEKKCFVGGKYVNKDNAEKMCDVDQVLESSNTFRESTCVKDYSDNIDKENVNSNKLNSRIESLDITVLSSNILSKDITSLYFKKDEFQCNLEDRAINSLDNFQVKKNTSRGNIKKYELKCDIEDELIYSCKNVQGVIGIENEISRITKNNKGAVLKNVVDSQGNYFEDKRETSRDFQSINPDIEDLNDQDKHFKDKRVTIKDFQSFNQDINSEFMDIESTFNISSDVRELEHNNISNYPKIPNKKEKNLKQDYFKTKISNGNYKLLASNVSSRIQKREMNKTSMNKITVCIRKRPLIKNERDVVMIEENGVVVNELKKRLNLTKYIEQHTFQFDHTFDKDIKNDEVYERLKGIVGHVINGGNGTVIAYGQTGTGKTHTMFHPKNGFIFLAIEEWLKTKKLGIISFFEIYNGTVYDLLDFREKIHLREKNGSVHFSNLDEREFTSSAEAIDIINTGMFIRRKGKTSANNESSRSHAILKIGSRKNETTNDGNCLFFVDLAGSERGNDRKDVNKLTRNEGAEINKSLLALKECIRGMDSASRFLPFRQSKLTQVLKNSFIGNSKTILLATICPGQTFVEHTLNTLKYASRIKESEEKIRGNRSRTNPHSEINNRNNSSIESLRSSFRRPIINDNSDFLTIKKGCVEEPRELKNEAYQKFTFDSKFIRENSNESINSSYLYDLNNNESEKICLLKSKIEKLTLKIKKEVENNGDLNILKRTSELLKFVEKKIIEMKFK